MKVKPNSSGICNPHLTHWLSFSEGIREKYAQASFHSRGQLILSPHCKFLFRMQQESNARPVIGKYLEDNSR